MMILQRRIQVPVKHKSETSEGETFEALSKNSQCFVAVNYFHQKNSNLNCLTGI